MTLDLDLSLKFLSLLMSVGAIVFAWIATRRKDVEGRFSAMTSLIDLQRQRIDAAEGRVSRVEQAIETLPGKDELHRLELNLASISGSLKGISATMEGQRDIMQRLETIVSRHEDHLLGEARK